MRFKNSFSQRVISPRGFTLVEIMIVLAILGTIFGLLAGKFTGAKDKANVKEAKIQMGQIQNALSMYYTDCAKYPAKLEGLQQKDDCANWGPEAYYSKPLVDPWKHPFSYESTGGDYHLKSLGKDGAEGGSGFAADISADDNEVGGGAPAGDDQKQGQ